MTDLQAEELCHLRVLDAIDWASDGFFGDDFIHHIYRRPSGVIDLFNQQNDPTYPAPWCHVGYIDRAGRVVTLAPDEFCVPGDYFGVATEIEGQFTN